MSGKTAGYESRKPDDAKKLSKKIRIRVTFNTP